MTSDKSKLNKSGMRADSLDGQHKKNIPGSTRRYLWKHRYLYLMLLPGILYYLIFCYFPMYGITIAFKNYSFKKGIIGSEWIGLSNFEYLFGLKKFWEVLGNSITISVYQFLWGFPVPILLAVIINELGSKRFKKVSQTLIYLPHFVSWVVIGGILINFLSPGWGMLNKIISGFGVDPIFFLGEPKYFRSIIVTSGIWKNAGWGTIIYLAGISGINPELYEAARIDGASRLQQTWHVTLPGIRQIIVLKTILSVGGLLNNGFEQFYILQNDANRSVSEVLETYTYRVGLLSGRYSFATAVGIFKSVVNMILLLMTNAIAAKAGDETVV